MRAAHLAQGGRPTEGATKPKRPRGARRKVRQYEALTQPPPRRDGIKPAEGIEAALQERYAFKVAGMLAVWRERWRHVLTPRHG